jgi:putative transposase
MPRRLRHTLQGTVFHVINRAAGRARLFNSPEDYSAFLRVTREGLSSSHVQLIAYCVMPNHWHFVVVCDRIADLSHLMHWITGTHAQRWHAAHGTRGTGPLYQGRFKAIPVQTETSLHRVCRYVERNPLRAQLVDRAEAWPWSSLFEHGKNCDVICSTTWPISRPPNWIEIVNRPESEFELATIQAMVRRDHPIGDPEWQRAVAPFCGLSLRAIGRPGKSSEAS